MTTASPPKTPGTAQRRRSAPKSSSNPRVCSNEAVQNKTPKMKRSIWLGSQQRRAVSQDLSDSHGGEFRCFVIGGTVHRACIEHRYIGEPAGAQQAPLGETEASRRCAGNLVNRLRQRKPSTFSRDLAQ